MGEGRFDKAAATWDEKPQRVALAAAIVATMQEVLPLSCEMAALEVGCGTGLLTCELAGQLKSVVATDTSQGMLAVLADKIATLGLDNVEGQRLDLLDNKGLAPESFDLIYSAMTLHHIKETFPFLAACFDHLKSGGILALADLEAEDGSFHDDMTGVHHCGFDLEKLAALAASCGFGTIQFRTAHRIAKETGGRLVDYPVFLMTAVRP